MRLLVASLALLAVALPAAAQERKVAWANKFFTKKGDESPPPIILHDFGTLPKGTIKTYRFTMRNIYTVPMQVTEPRPSCGCISIVSYTGKMDSMQTGHIEVKLDTSRVEGAKVVKIPVRFEGRDPKTNEPFWSDAQLEVRTVSVADIMLNPGAVEFGAVAAGTPAKQVVRLDYTGRQRDWKVSEVGFRKELLDVRVAETRKGSYTIEVAVKENASVGAFDEQVVLKTNDRDPQTQSLVLMVRGSVQAPLAVAGGADLVKFPAVAVGTSTDRRVSVASQKLFKIARVEGQGDGVTARLDPMPANKTQVVVIAFKPEKPGPVKKVLTVVTDAGEKVTITVEGLGTEPK